MPSTRDHDPLVLEEFGGWWDRGDPESTPSDHFIQADNIQYFPSGFETRDGLVNYLANGDPSFKVKRVYNYITLTGDTLLALSGNSIYHIVNKSSVPVTPILTLAGMEDFGFVAINGRAYITPFKQYTNTQGETYSLGLPGVDGGFLYVYKGDQTPAHKAAGQRPLQGGGGLLFVESDAGGVTDPGRHLVAVVYETDTGYLTALGPELFGQHIYSGGNKIRVSNIPVSPDSFVVRRHLVSTKAIPDADWNFDQNGYQFFFIPGGTINDNTTTFKIVEYFDSDLIADASHLIDNFSEIPAGVSLTTYHSRLVLVGEYGTTESLQGLPPGVTDNRSIARISFPGEPESISKIDGLIVVPLDGQALTTAQEFRDVLYLFKHTRTYVYSDNNDEPVTWQEEVLDQGIGAPVHGVASVLDSGGVNTDFLIIVDWSGLMLFNGIYARPELSFKIEDFWKKLSRNDFHCVEIVNDSINKKIWITLPPPNRNYVLHADYSDGMNPDKIQWARWIFHVDVTTITLIDTDNLVIGTTGPHIDVAINPLVVVS